MSQEKVKVQILLPKDLVIKIEQDAEKLFLKRSTWFEKLASTYFVKNREKEGEHNKKKTITLNI